MKTWFKNNALALVTLLISFGGVGFGYIRDRINNRDLERQTIECLRMIGREETDVDKEYFKTTGLEIRSSNHKQGFYHFYGRWVEKVYKDEHLDDYYRKKGTEKEYLSNEKN